MRNSLLSRIYDAMYWQDYGVFSQDTVFNYFDRVEADTGYRHWLVKNNLFSGSLDDRDSAINIIDTDVDHSLIPALQFAIHCEPNMELRSDMQDILNEFESDTT